MSKLSELVFEIPNGPKTDNNKGNSSEILLSFLHILEYPQYTRPEVFEGEKVPEVLLSGNHQNINKWRKEKSLEITKNKRPDLLLK